MKLKQLFNQANIYIFLWCLYYLQGTLYVSGSSISQAILAILILMSIYNAIYLNLHYKLPNYFKGLNALIIMFTFYGVYLILSNEIIIFNFRRVPNFDYLKNVYISLLPIYSAYLYTIRNQLTDSSIKKWIFIWLIIATAQYYRYEQEALTKFYYKTEVTNNMGYVFLALMPTLVIFNKKPIIQFPLLLYCITYVIIGMKRGAIFIALLIFIYFIYQAYKTVHGNKKRYILLFSIVSIITTIMIIMNMMETSEYFTQRIENTIEGDTSNRDKLYGSFISHFSNESNIFKFLFGNGANSTIVIGGIYAHNDWLEILINNGIIGVFTYIIYWICFVNSWLKSKSTINAFSALLMILLISFMQTLFSMSYSSLEIYMTLSLGYFFAISYKQISIRL